MTVGTLDAPLRAGDTSQTRQHNHANSGISRNARRAPSSQESQGSSTNVKAEAEASIMPDQQSTNLRLRRAVSSSDDNTTQGRLPSGESLDNSHDRVTVAKSGETVPQPLQTAASRAQELDRLISSLKDLMQKQQTHAKRARALEERIRVQKGEYETMTHQIIELQGRLAAKRAQIREDEATMAAETQAGDQDLEQLDRSIARIAELKG